MKYKNASRVVLASLLIALSTAWATDLQTQMESANAAWLNAYNARDGRTLGMLYTRDAILLPPNNEAVRGAAQIEKFWTDQTKDEKYRNYF